MYTRHNEVPRYCSEAGVVSAIHYNHVLTGLSRLNKQLRYAIPRLKHLDLILQKDAWIVVDRVLNDIPIVAWTNFQVDKRESLHKAIKCDVYLFHYAADLIMDRTLEAMELMLGEELSDYLPDELSDVLPFKKPDGN